MKTIIAVLMACLFWVGQAWGFPQGFVAGMGVGPAVAAGVGGWTFIAGSGLDGGPTSVSTLDAVAALDINAGDVIVAAMRWETGNTTCSFGATTGDANTFAGTVVQAANDITHICVGYNLVATNNDTATIRGTLGAAQTYTRLMVMQFRPTNAGVATADGSPSTATGTSTTPTSGSYSSSGDDPLIIAVSGSYDNTYSLPLIGGSAADGYQQNGSVALMWYHIGSVSSVTAAATLPASQAWASTILGIK